MNATSESSQRPLTTGGRSLSPLLCVPEAQHKHIFDLLGLTTADRFIDIGCGPGHIVVRAAEQCGAFSCGIDIRQDYIEEARSLASEKSVTHLTEFLIHDLREIELCEQFQRATCAYMYLMPQAITMLEPALVRAVQRGMRVVTFFTDPSGHLQTQTEVDERLFGMLRLYATGPPSSRFFSADEDDSTTDPDALD